MIDRLARNNLLAAIDAYLAGAIKSFEFDKQIHDRIPKTKDEAVNAIITQLYLLYDDLIDHPVNLTKETWDYVQRLRLILYSDATLIATKTRTSRCPFAIVAFLTLTLTVVFLGWGGPLLLLNVAIGLVATITLYYRQPSTKAALLRLERVPISFPTYSSLKTLRQSTPTFKKNPYPRTLDLRPLRTIFPSSLMKIPAIVLFPLISPLPLLLLLLPLMSCHTVKLPTSIS